MSGEMDKLKGRAKQAAGDLTDNDELEREGQRDESAGKLKDTVDDVEDGVDDAIDSVKRKVN
ncbi:MAG: CsbD family protein [Acidimicrobiales bacterium]|nr:CsbD family protein [Acidimicrobiales bacterium]